jgi:uncharacterized protein YkwD
MALHAGFILGIACAAVSVTAAQEVSPLEPGILKSLNQFRADPASYVPILRERRQYYKGNRLQIAGKPDLITQEGVRAVDEAIGLLESIHGGRGGVALSAGLSRAAADHVLDTGSRGSTSHAGSDGSNFAKRIARYGTWSGEIGEDISYGAREAREVIVELLIDDGVANRGHRKSLLNPAWRYVGIACGPHAVYGTMCVMDFASAYEDR